MNGKNLNGAPRYSELLSGCSVLMVFEALKFLFYPFYSYLEICELKNAVLNTDKTKPLGTMQLNYLF